MLDVFKVRTPEDDCLLYLSVSLWSNLIFEGSCGVLVAIWGPSLPTASFVHLPHVKSQQVYPHSAVIGLKHSFLVGFWRMPRMLLTAENT